MNGLKEKVECAKEYLGKVRRIDKMIDAKCEQLDQLKQMATRVTKQISYTNVQTSGHKDIGDIIVKIVDLEYEINDDIDQLVDLKRQVIKEVDSLENDDYRLLLTLKYLNYKTIEEIAEEMMYSTRHITRLHKEALIDFNRLS